LEHLAVLRRLQARITHGRGHGAAANDLLTSLRARQSNNQRCRLQVGQLEVLPAPTPTMTMKSIELKNIDNSTKSDMQQHPDTQKDTPSGSKYSVPPAPVTGPLKSPAPLD
jgi:hypothetical protein